jgi:hypothetical protein
MKITSGIFLLGTAEILSILGDHAVAAQPIWRNFESEQAQSEAFAAQTNETSLFASLKWDWQIRGWRNRGG